MRVQMGHAAQTLAAVLPDAIDAERPWGPPTAIEPLDLLRGGVVPQDKSIAAQTR